MPDLKKRTSQGPGVNCSSDLKNFANSNQGKISQYTHSLVPADFSGAVFTCAFFQKILFLLYKLRNAFLVTNDLSGADLVHADFCQT